MTNKQPKLVLREACIADVTREWVPGTFLEAGAGTGHMTRIFLERGFTGASHDLGESSRAAMRRNLAGFPGRMLVVDALDELPDESFDYLFAFEVLEHIEDDEGALREWAKKLRPGGRLLVSVPAHARKFGRSDDMVGHVRRYERKGMERLMTISGFGAIDMVNYGFPVTEITRRISNKLIKGENNFSNLSAEQRSVLSAQAKPKVIERLLRIFGGNVFIPFCWVQRTFYRHDLGDGLVAWATKLHLADGQSQ
jgi:SAM-dependent methyltransferase